MNQHADSPEDPDLDKVDPGAPLQGMLAHILSEMDGEDSNLRDIVMSLGKRAFGPVMLLCGLFMMTPLGAIPGVPAAFGLVNTAFAVQILARRPYPWIPAVLRRVEVPFKRVEKAEAFARPWLARIDNLIRPRLRWATEGPMLLIAALISILLSISMVPLGLIPFGVVPSAFILGLLGLSITARDGGLMLFAIGLCGGLCVWFATLLG